MLIDWFRVLLRHDWLGSWRVVNKKEPKVVSAVTGLERIRKARERRGLDLPYGKRWERLKSSSANAEAAA